ncbi:hypothetical protein NDN08_006866 [Rhodosorus marinus]|uniref:FMP27 GFWDK domain-containing protein n=1 Tax=Rhodosorus marinus TaxID=101924 RepID=A0AAV8ULZ6_9RHOD|nr:hypothetical protein NDN08_006866 [Rhodosorus marinus]
MSDEATSGIAAAVFGLVAVLAAQLFLLPVFLGGLVTFLVNRQARIRARLSRGTGADVPYFSVGALHIFPLAGMVTAKRLVVVTAGMAITIADLRIQLMWWRNLAKRIRSAEELENRTVESKIDLTAEVAEKPGQRSLVYVVVSGATVRIVNGHWRSDGTLSENQSLYTRLSVSMARRMAHMSAQASGFTENTKEQDISHFTRLLELVVFDFYFATVISCDPFETPLVRFSADSCRSTLSLESTTYEEDKYRIVTRLKLRNVGLSVLERKNFAVVEMDDHKGNWDFSKLPDDLARKREMRTRKKWPLRLLLKSRSAAVQYEYEVPGELNSFEGCNNATFPEHGLFVRLEESLAVLDTEALALTGETIQRMVPRTFVFAESVDDVYEIGVHDKRTHRAFTFELEIRQGRDDIEPGVEGVSLIVPFVPGTSWEESDLTRVKTGGIRSKLLLASKNPLSLVATFPLLADESGICATHAVLQGENVELLSRGIVDSAVVNTEKLRIVADSTKGVAWNDPIDTTVSVQFQKTRGLFMMCHVSILADIAAGGISSKDPGDARYFIPGSLSVTLNHSGGYDIGMGCNFENIWNDPEYPRLPKQTDWTYQIVGRDKLRFHFKSCSERYFSLVTTSRWELDVPSSSVYLRGPVRHAFLRDISLDEKVMDFPELLNLRAVTRSHSQKVLEAVDTNDMECTIKPTRFALGSKHLQFLFNWIANHFGETSAVRRAAAQTSSGLAEGGEENTDWIYYKDRASSRPLPANPGVARVKINFLDALLTLVGRVDAGWLPKHVSVNVNGLPNARKFPFVGLRTAGVRLEIESGYSGSTLMMKTDSAVTTFNNGTDYFPSRDPDSNDNTLRIDSLLLKRLSTFDDNGRESYLAEMSLEVGRISGVLTLPELLALNEFGSTLDSIVFADNKGADSWVTGLEQLSLLKGNLSPSRFYVSLMRGAVKNSVFIAEVEFDRVLFTKSGLATANWSSTTKVLVDNLGYRMLQLHDAPSPMVAVEDVERLLDEGREDVVLKRLSMKVMSAFTPEMYSPHYEKVQQDFLKKVDKEKGLLQFLFDSDASLVEGNGLGSRFVKFWKDNGVEAGRDKRTDTELLKGLTTTSVEVSPEVDLAIGFEVMANVITLLDALEAQARLHVSAETALVDLWKYATARFASIKEAFASGNFRSIVKLPETRISVIADESLESAISEVGVHLPSGLRAASEVSGSGGIVRNTLQVALEEGRLFAVRDDVEADEEIDLLEARYLVYTAVSSILILPTRLTTLKAHRDISVGGFSEWNADLSDVVELSKFVASCAPWIGAATVQVSKLTRWAEARVVISMTQAVGLSFDEFRGLNEERAIEFLYDGLSVVRSINGKAQLKSCERYLGMVAGTAIDGLPRIPPERRTGAYGYNILIPEYRFSLRGSKCLIASPVLGHATSAGKQATVSVHGEAVHLHLNSELVGLLSDVKRDFTRTSKSMGAVIKSVRAMVGQRKEDAAQFLGIATTARPTDTSVSTLQTGSINDLSWVREIASELHPSEDHRRRGIQVDLFGWGERYSAETSDRFPLEHSVRTSVFQRRRSVADDFSQFERSRSIFRKARSRGTDAALDISAASPNEYFTFHSGGLRLALLMKNFAVQVSDEPNQLRARFTVKGLHSLLSLAGESRAISLSTKEILTELKHEQRSVRVRLKRLALQCGQGRKVTTVEGDIGDVKLHIKNDTLLGFQGSILLAADTWMKPFQRRPGRHLGKVERENDPELRPPTGLVLVTIGMRSAAFKNTFPRKEQKYISLMAIQLLVDLSAHVNWLGEIHGSLKMHLSRWLVATRDVMAKERLDVKTLGFQLFAYYNVGEPVEIDLKVGRLVPELSLESWILIIRNAKEAFSRPRGSRGYRRPRTSTRHRVQGDRRELPPVVVACDVEGQEHRVFGLGVDARLAFERLQLRFSIHIGPSSSLEMKFSLPTLVVALKGDEDASLSKLALHEFESTLELSRRELNQYCGLNLISVRTSVERAFFLAQEHFVEKANLLLQSASFADATEETPWKQEEDEDLFDESNPTQTITKGVGSLSFGNLRFLVMAPEKVDLRLSDWTHYAQIGDYQFVSVQEHSDLDLMESADPVIVSSNSFHMLSSLNRSSLLLDDVPLFSTSEKVSLSVRNFNSELRCILDVASWRIDLQKSTVQNLSSLLAGRTTPTPSSKDPALQGPELPWNHLDIVFNINGGKFQTKLGHYSEEIPFPNVRLAIVSDYSRGVDLVDIVVHEYKVDLRPIALENFANVLREVQPPAKPQAQPPVGKESRKTRTGEDSSASHQPRISGGHAKRPGSTHRRGRKLSILLRTGKLNIAGVEQVSGGLFLRFGLRCMQGVQIFASHTHGKFVVNLSLESMSLHIGTKNMNRVQPLSINLGRVRALIGQARSTAHVQELTMNCHLLSVIAMLKAATPPAKPGNIRKISGLEEPSSVHDTTGLNYICLLFGYHGMPPKPSGRTKLPLPVWLALNMTQPSGDIGIGLNSARVELKERTVDLSVAKFDTRLRWESLRGIFQLRQARYEHNPSGTTFGAIWGLKTIASRASSFPFLEGELAFAKFSVYHERKESFEHVRSLRKIALRVSECRTKVSSNSIPASKRFTTLLSRLLTDSSDISSAFTRGRGLTLAVPFNNDSEDSTSVSGGPSAQPAAAAIVEFIEGDIMAFVDVLEVAAHRFSFEEPDRVVLHLRECNLHYSQAWEALLLLQHLHMSFENFQIFVGNGRLTSVPRSDTQLICEEEGNRLSFHFSASFSDEVEISSTATLYRNLTDMVKIFLSSSTPRIRTVPGPPDDAQEVLRQHHDDSLEVGNGDERTVVPNQNKPVVYIGNKRVRIETMVFSPRLRALGQLTPSLDTVLGWMGVGNVKVIPIWVYEYLAAPLGSFLGSSSTLRSDEKAVVR